LFNEVKKVQSIVPGKIPGKTPSRGIDLSKLESKDLKDAITSFIDAYKDYQITKEQEHTKREAIDADLKKYLTKVNQTKDVLSDYLSNQFSSRKETIDELFTRLDRALDEDKDNVAIQVLTTLEGIVKENPLKEVEQIGKAFVLGGELEI
jgi:hypothetical protein